MKDDGGGGTRRTEEGREGWRRRDTRAGGEDKTMYQKNIKVEEHANERISTDLHDTERCNRKRTQKI